jgi:hypothetical protein
MMKGTGGVKEAAGDVGCHDGLWECIIIMDSMICRCCVFTC